MKKDKKNKKNTLGIAIGILGTVIVVLAIILVVILVLRSKDINSIQDEASALSQQDKNANDENQQGNGQVTVFPILPDENGIPVAQIDIDINELKSKNLDACAWIYIPDSDVNCAVMCNVNDPNYYSIFDIENIKGVFIQNYNNVDFSDRMTVIYGKQHNDGNQFAGIHKYADKSFYENHKYIYICTEDKILTYKVFAAHKAYAEHLVLGYDFTQDGIFLEYLSGVLKGDEEVDPSANIDSDTVIMATDKILTLSDKIDGEDDYRYLVQGVLVSETEKDN